ncbi:hypothetical protein SAMN04489860_0800 [Paraoerskovia marina]|uniref:Dolichyl-phosphate-mannose-protein mannosyltransferase n=1 Tax=Paraoerskovia marina TaxID=545619 RepID=A0A1H1PGA2_9CELL|nr:hypothetical protein [Paraoerskovia marina]SDS10272.1 hypothetical protein SAMN04489860_0800 [Paraoerskovia marina]
MRRYAPLLAAVVWAVSVPLVWWWGRWLQDQDEVLLLGGAPPFAGLRITEAGWGTLAAVGVAALVLWRGPRLARTLRWGVLLAVGWATALAWTLALGASVRWSDLTEPLTNENDYLPAVPGASADPSGFLATLQSDPMSYPVHVRGHPPGFTLLLAGMDRVGLGGAGWAAALVILAGTSAVVAVALTIRLLGGAAGERTARAAMPAVVLAPSAIWVATSADAFYAGVLAWGTALLAVGTTSRGRARWAAVVGAGLLLGWAPFLSYGLLHMGLVVLAVPIVTRRWWPTVVAGLLVVATLVAWGLAGFWLWDGIAATHEAWSNGKASARPYGYFLVADIVLLGALIGPAGVGGTARWRRLDPATAWLAALAIVAAAAGAFGGFERGEVERVWLPLACWIVPVAGALALGTGTGERPGDGRTWRWWLGAQAATAIAIETLVVTPW